MSNTEFDSYAVAKTMLQQCMTARTTALSGILPAETRDVCDLTREDGLPQPDTIWSMLCQTRKYWYSSDIVISKNPIRIPEHLQEQCLLAAYTQLVSNTPYDFEELVVNGQIQSPDLETQIVRLLPRQILYRLPPTDIFRLTSEMVFFMLTDRELTVAERNAMGGFAISTKAQVPTAAVAATQIQQLNIVQNAFQKAHEMGSPNMHQNVENTKQMMSKILKLGGYQHDEFQINNNLIYQTFALLLCAVIVPVIHNIITDLFAIVWDKMTQEELREFERNDAKRNEIILQSIKTNPLTLIAENPMDYTNITTSTINNMNNVDVNWVPLIAYFITRAMPTAKALNMQEIVNTRFDNTLNPMNNKKYIDNTLVITNSDELVIADIAERSRSKQAIDLATRLRHESDTYTTSMFDYPLKLMMQRNAIPPRGSDVRLPLRMISKSTDCIGTIMGGLDEDKDPAGKKASWTTMWIARAFFTTPEYCSFIDDRQRRFVNSTIGRIYKQITFPLLPAPMSCQYNHPLQQLVMPMPTSTRTTTKTTTYDDVVSSDGIMTQLALVGMGAVHTHYTTFDELIKIVESKAKRQFNPIGATENATIQPSNIAIEQFTLIQQQYEDLFYIDNNNNNNSNIGNNNNNNTDTDNNVLVCNTEESNNGCSGTNNNNQQNKDKKQQYCFYVTDFSAIEEIPVRIPYLRYGAILVLNSQFKPIAIYISHMYKWVFNPSTYNYKMINQNENQNQNENDDIINNNYKEYKRLWQYGKFVWKTTMFLYITIKDHLTLSHLTEGNAIVTGSQMQLPLNNTLRNITKPFTYCNTFINRLACTSLYFPGAFVNRIWSYSGEQTVPLMKYIVSSHYCKPYIYYMHTNMRYTSLHIKNFKYTSDPTIYYNASKIVDYKYQFIAFYLLNYKKLENIETRIINELKNIIINHNNKKNITAVDITTTNNNNQNQIQQEQLQLNDDSNDDKNAKIEYINNLLTLKEEEETTTTSSSLLEMPIDLFIEAYNGNDLINDNNIQQQQQQQQQQKENIIYQIQNNNNKIILLQNKPLNYINPKLIRAKWREELKDIKKPTIDLTLLQNIPYYLNLNYHTLNGPQNPQFDRVYPLTYDIDRFWHITFDYVQSTWDLISQSIEKQDLFDIKEYRSFFNGMLELLSVKSIKDTTIVAQQIKPRQRIVPDYLTLLNNEYFNENENNQNENNIELCCDNIKECNNQQCINNKHKKEATNEFLKVCYGEKYYNLIEMKKDIENTIKTYYNNNNDNTSSSSLGPIIQYINKIRFVVLLTQLIVNGTILHELAGGVCDFVQSPTLIGVRLDPRHEFQDYPMQYIQEYTQLLLLSQFTGGKTTGLLSQTPQFFYNQNIIDKNLYKHRINWLLYKKDLLQLVVENDFRNKYCRDFPCFAGNPRNLEGSVSI